MSKEEMKLALDALEAGEYYIDDLEAIVYAADDLGTHEDRAKMQAAITALREALAEQPAQTDWEAVAADQAMTIALLKAERPAQQEPVAQWQKRHPHHWEGKWENTNEHDAKWWRDNSQGWEIRALYTSQPAQPQQETWEHLKVYGYAPGGYMMTCRGCNTTVIGVDKRALRCKPCAIKAASTKQQEPVAYMYEQAKYGPTDLRGQQWRPALSRNKPYTGDDKVRCLRPLYTHPIFQTWAGLTDEEVKECFESVPTQDCQNYEHWRSLCARNIEAKLKEKNT